MNRRRFLQSLGIGMAMLTLGFRPKIQDENMPLRFKGRTDFEVGYIYAPYFPLYVTPPISVADVVKLANTRSSEGRRS
jgi:hypothetical protein